MYFELDKEDYLYDINHEKIYRLIATEKIKTIDPNSEDLIRDTIIIQAGTKGGYVGSELCLEEKYNCELKPWVFYGSQLSEDSILAGSSILTGNTKVYDNSIIDGANVIKDTVICNSTIITKKSKQKGSRILLSVFAYKESKLKNTIIKTDNIIIRSTTLNNCTMQDGYGNIRFKNSELKNIILTHDIAIENTALFNEQKMVTLKPNVIYISGKKENATPITTLKLKGKLYSHEVINEMWNEIKNDYGIYRNVNYNPNKFNNF